MYSLAAKSVTRRAAVFPPLRSVIAGKRFSSTEHGNDPDVIEVEKQRNMRKEQHKTSTTIPNAPGWNQYLASASEAAVKADRSDHSPERLTADTLKHIKARHHSENAPTPRPEQVPPTPREAVNGEERIDAYEASYERDGMTGPLNDAAPTEEIQRETYKERVTKEVHIGI